MKCSKCGAEFDAKFCPECGTPANAQTEQVNQPVQSTPQQPAYQNPVTPQKKKGGCLKGGLIAIGVIVVIGIIAAIAGGGGKSAAPTAASAPTSTAAIASAPLKAQVSSSAETSLEQSKTYGVGKTASSNDVKMTLVSVKEVPGSEYNKPEKGNVFLLCEFTIENDSKNDLGISSMASFEAYVDGYSVNQSLTGLIEKGNKNQLDGNVAAGKKMNGVIAYEVPKDWKEIEIRLNPSVFSIFSEETIFKATK